MSGSCKARSVNNDITDCVYVVAQGAQMNMCVREETAIIVFAQKCLDKACVCGGENSKAQAGEVRLSDVTRHSGLVWHDGSACNPQWWLTDVIHLEPFLRFSGHLKDDVCVLMPKQWDLQWEFLPHDKTKRTTVTTFHCLYFNLNREQRSSEVSTGLSPWELWQVSTWGHLVKRATPALGPLIDRVNDYMEKERRKQ